MAVRRFVAVLLVVMLLLTSGLTPVLAGCADGGGSGGGCRKGWDIRDLVIQKTDPRTKESYEIIPGKMYLKNTLSKFKLELVAETGWQIAETRIFVGADPVPVNEDGNPDMGAFTYREKFPQPVDTYELVVDLRDPKKEAAACDQELDLFSTMEGPGKPEKLNIAVYVKMKGAGDRGQTLNEDAWARGEELNVDSFTFADGGWWMIYTLEDDNEMFRKNVSKNPDFVTTKAKIEIMHYYVRAQKANGDPVTLEYETIDSFNDDGTKETVIEERQVVKPLVAVYAEQMPGDATLYPDKYTGLLTERAQDVFGAVSLDEGNTWKRTNLSRAADRSSFTLGDRSLYPGFEFPGEVKKPNVKQQGNNILVAWTSKYAKQGHPTYSLPEFLEDGTLNPYYEEDIWGVGGAQQSKDYTNVEAGFPGIEIPYSTIWTCRGFVEMVQDTDEDGNKVGEPYSKITWMQPERLTSGRRDAEQVAVASSPSGFIVTWQEDPDGLRPGDGAGPGHGWSGATVNNGTDIWYSYILMEDFKKIDKDFVPSGGSGGGSTCDDFTVMEKDPDKEHGGGRPRALVPMKLPVRITDNDKLNTDNMKIDSKLLVDCPNDILANYPLAEEGKLFVLYKSDLDEGIVSPASLAIGLLGCGDDDCGGGGGGNSEGTGSHSYGLALPDLLWRHTGSDDPYILFYEKINNQGAIKYVAITTDDRLMEGGEGASRPGIMMQNYQKADGTYSAWVVLGYEQSKGVGSGSPEGGGGCGDDGDDGGCGSDSEEKEPGSGEGSTRYFPDRGKNIMYHSFDFQNPDLVNKGDYLNPQEVEPVYDSEGNIERLELSWLREGTYNPETNKFDLGDYIRDWKGELIANRENARRPRFIIQSKAMAIAGKADDEKGTVMTSVYKMGKGGKGDPADVMIIRWEASRNDKGNPYDFKYLAKETYTYWCPIEEKDIPHKDVDWQNLGSVTAVDYTVEYTTKLEPYNRIYSWEQTVENLSDYTWMEPGINSRAHRGFIRGDFLAIAYVYTPNWRQARNGHDIYNTYIRRSFDGGKTWTTDPDGEGVTQWEIMKDDEGNRYVEESFINAGEFQPARNVSLLKNNKVICIEPRLVGQPGSTSTQITPLLVELVDSLTEGDIGSSKVLFPQDRQDPKTFWMTYGTEETVYKDDNKEWVDGEPVDLFYSYSTDRGETFNNVELDYLKDDKETKTNGFDTWDWLAKDRRGIVIEQAECQIRYLPNGSVFYAIWNEASEEGSDAIFRRIFRASQVGDIVGIKVVTSTVTPEPGEYTLTFIVEDADDDPIEGALINVSGVGTETTNAIGEAVFENLSSATYNYSVSKAGYRTAVDSVQIDEKDVIKPVTLLPAPSATVGDITVNGTVDAAITAKDVVITVANDTFKAIGAEANLAGWFINLPAGLTATAKGEVAEGATVVTIEIAGTPTEAIEETMNIEIPADLLNVSTSDLPVAENLNAKFEIVEQPVIEPGTLCGEKSTFTFSNSANTITVTALDTNGNAITDLGTSDWAVTLSHGNSKNTIINVSSNGNVYTITVSNIQTASETIMVKYGDIEITPSDTSS